MANIGEDKKRQLQVIKCLCGASIAACTEPECYEEKDWQKELRRYVKMGYTVSLEDAGSFSFGSCSCKEEATKQPELF